MILSLILLSASAVSGFTSPTVRSQVKIHQHVESCTFGLPKHSYIRESSSCLFDSSSAQSPDNWEREWKDSYSSQSDSYPLQPIKETQARRQRLRNEREIRDRFLQGDELIELRSDITRMQTELKKAMKNINADKVQSLRVEIDRAQKRDAEFVYEQAQQNLVDAKLDGTEEEISAFQNEIVDARRSIPQFNLEGMWVGKYGSHGYEMINVTYVGDTLYAYKVTGDQNVPKGKITFKADLSPKSNTQLAPIELTSPAAKQWGIKHLIRFPGEGQVAAEGFKNSQFMEGQFMMVGEYFSFAWIPIGHQIFFGRPSPELTLKMLKESRAASSEDDVNRMRDFAMRCLEETNTIEEHEKESLTYISTLGFGDGDLEGCFE